MAAPIIDSVTAFPAGPYNPGQSFTVTVVAHDPDARTVTLNATATDAEGNVSAVSTTTVSVADPLTFQLTASDPGVTITPGTAGVFTVTV